MDILADTNILVRRIRRSDPQYRQTRDAVNRLKSDGHRICVTSQNLIELWAVCTRPVESNGLGLTPAYAERVLARIERSVVRLQDSDSVYPEWKRLVAQFGVSGKTTHDARLVAAMNIHSVKSIITFNIPDFMRYTEIQAVRPADSQCIRLPYGVAAAPRGVAPEPVGMDAVELPRCAGTAGPARRGVVG